jgi:L-ascorbate metabolism protein UlaG (beta-lactamase superfamily)
MDARGARRVAKMIGPAVSIPLHYDTFPPTEIDVSEWQSLFSEEDFNAHVLQPGETLDI